MLVVITFQHITLLNSRVILLALPIAFLLILFWVIHQTHEDNQIASIIKSHDIVKIKATHWDLGLITIKNKLIAWHTVDRYWLN